MLHSKFLLVCLLAVTGLLTGVARADKTLTFSGHEWQVRDAEIFGPGPNAWDQENVWLDEQGRLHLKISQRDGKWRCAELKLKQNLGFGRYQWQIVGRLDQFDPNVVLGLFNYTIPEVGPDGTNEIDIEYTRWGNANTPAGNFSVWPATDTVKGQTHPFEFKLDGDYTTQRFDWTPQSVNFQMLGGHRDDDQNPLASWAYTPNEPEKYIPQKPLPIHLNFWLFRGQAPQNNQDAEVVISKFSFIPLATINKP